MHLAVPSPEFARIVGALQQILILALSMSGALGAAFEDVVLRAVDEVVQIIVIWRAVVALEHVAPLLLIPKEGRLCTIRAVIRARREVQFRFCATTMRPQRMNVV